MVHLARQIMGSILGGTSKVMQPAKGGPPAPLKNQRAKELRPPPTLTDSSEVGGGFEKGK